MFIFFKYILIYIYSPLPPKKDCNNQLSFVYEKNSKLKILFLSDW